MTLRSQINLEKERLTSVEKYVCCWVYFNTLENTFDRKHIFADPILNPQAI